MKKDLWLSFWAFFVGAMLGGGVMAYEYRQETPVVVKEAVSEAVEQVDKEWETKLFTVTKGVQEAAASACVEQVNLIVDTERKSCARRPEIVLPIAGTVVVSCADHGEAISMDTVNRVSQRIKCFEAPVMTAADLAIIHTVEVAARRKTTAAADQAIVTAVEAAAAARKKP